MEGGSQEWLKLEGTGAVVLYVRRSCGRRGWKMDYKRGPSVGKKSKRYWNRE